MIGLPKQLNEYFRSEDTCLIRRILSENAVRHWRGYTLAISMTLVLAACTSLTAYLVGSVVNKTYLDRNFAAVAALSAALVVLFAVKGLATYAYAVMVARVGNRITAETQSRIFDKLLGQSLSFLADRHSTEFMVNAVIGAAAISRVMSMLVLALGRDVLSLIALVLVMIWQDPVLSLTGVAVMPIALFGVQKLLMRVRQIATTQINGAGSMLASMQETLQGFKIVKAFNREEAARARFEASVKDVERATNRLSRVSSRTEPLVEALGGIAIGLACLYCGYRVLKTNAAPGEFVSFMTAFLLAFDPARRLARLKIDLAGALQAARGLYVLFDSPSIEPSDIGKPVLRVDRARIEFKDVEFAYRPGVPVLRGMSFVAEPGRVTALVGPSGSGKTTIFNLLLGFYETNRGSISIDGQSLKGVTRRSLRHEIAYVGQDVFLFDGSIRDNILLGNTDATEDQLIAAAKAAFAHDFICSFPRGYDTPVGEAGSQLSLGQRQRISLARALIKNSQIVLLDEATASLDSESEHFVQQAIRRLCAGKTTIVIAHRLNTIADADCIHVIEDGVVVETGTHGELLGKSGRYTTFCLLQFPPENPGTRKSQARRMIPA